MSGLLRRRDLHRAASQEALTERSAALAKAVDVGADRLDPQLVASARALTDKLRERTSVAGSRTVAALAGATGSGKSTLFNTLVGQEVSKISPIRPTTRVATASIWGPEPSAPLLDWLKVDRRHQVPTSADAALLDGLVLLDLPDFDSRVSEHRAEADRLLGLVDVFVWVTDPQKYADAVLHDNYVRAMSTHGAVTLVVLNQIDQLPTGAVAQCVADLQQLLARDGLDNAVVIPTSAMTGQGLDDLVEAIGSVVQRHNAAEQRLLADVRATAGRLRQGVGDREAVVDEGADSELTDALSRAAGVPVVVESVRRDYARRASLRGGWPVTRWVSKLRPAPLTRVGLEKIAGTMTRSEANVVLGRSSLPPATPAARAAVDVATRKLGARAAAGLPPRWASAVEDAATPSDAALHDSLDQAVVGTSLRDRDPAWWTVMSVLQGILFAIAIAGLVWLLVLAGLGWAQIHVSVPTWGWLPIPLLMLAGGLLVGALLAMLARALAATGARRRATKIDKRLRASIATVGQEQIEAPVRAVLADHRVTREQLDLAAR